MSAARMILPLALLTGCASRQASTVGQPLTQPTMLSLACGRALSMVLRIRSTSASLMIDGDGPYILSQVTSRSGLSVYSDGTHTIQLNGDQVSYALGRSVLRPCTRS